VKRAITPPKPSRQTERAPPSPAQAPAVEEPRRRTITQAFDILDRALDDLADDIQFLEPAQFAEKLLVAWAEHADDYDELDHWIEVSQNIRDWLERFEEALQPSNPSEAAQRILDQLIKHYEQGGQS
jgi:hypothetical protein